MNVNEPNLEAADQDATQTSEPDLPKEDREAVPASPLTDEQIARLSREANFDFCNNFDSFTVTFARAIEHAHGIGKLDDTGTKP